MGKIIDLTGQKYGKLIVLEKTDKRINRSVVWKCLCACGNIVEISSNSLRTKNTQSCGCGAMNKKVDLSNQRFGFLIALNPTLERDKSRHILWECLCDCGTFIKVPSNSLQDGNTKSCGCQTKNLASQNLRKDLTGKRFGKLIVEKITEQRVNQKIIWQCKCDCGSVVYVKSGSLLNGDTKSCGCLKSLGEYQISKILQDNNIPYIREYRLETNPKYRYDFALLDREGAVFRLIEFDGEQHYQESRGIWGENSTLADIKNSDKIKTEIAKINQIPLIRIPYWYRNKITLPMLIGDDFLCIE